MSDLAGQYTLSEKQFQELGIVRKVLKKQLRLHISQVVKTIFRRKKNRDIK